MYGLMFGDVGHGLLLSLAGLWLMHRKGSLAQLAPILVICGISAMGFGFLYGAVFGQPLLPVIWLRPMDNIMNLLLFSIAGGVVLLNIGFFTNVVMALRRGHWSSSFLDENGVVGIWLYWALLGTLVALLRGVQIVPMVWALALGAPALLLLAREPLANLAAGRRPLLENSWGEYLLLAFFELFVTVLGYISNSLSFVRLGAFAVAHEGLSQAVYLLAGMGGGFGWVIWIGGTIFITAFEGFIVGIQAMRLEYYEFFGKFFRGAGQRFTPLRLPDL
jgi:V/A-type H+-transporting ATPase subunit I